MYVQYICVNNFSFKSDIMPAFGKDIYICVWMYECMYVYWISCTFTHMLFTKREGVYQLMYT